MAGQPGCPATLFDCASFAAVVEIFSSFVYPPPRQLGQQGPQNATATASFPTSSDRALNCSDVNDYAYDFAGSHKRCRHSPTVREDIAPTL